jgi:hypothetical protein
VLPLSRQLRRSRAARRRRSLARAVRKQAENERRHRLAAGAVDSSALAARNELYDDIATCLEADTVDLDTAVTSRLRSLLADPRPLVDYGPYARARDAEIAAIRDELLGSELR